MTTKLSLFDPYIVDDQAILLASHLPVGRIWQGAFAPDSNIGKLIRGLSFEYYRLQVLAQKVSIEMDTSQANELLIEWEKSAGIPDSCFSTNASIERRRKQIEQKFSNFGGVQIASDFIRVAAVFGMTITVTPGSDFGSTKADMHTLYINILGGNGSPEYFPLPFPIPFSSDGATLLKCIFDKLAPANVKVIVT